MVDEYEATGLCITNGFIFMHYREKTKQISLSFHICMQVKI